jgi:type VI secretion system protein ImpE
MNARELLKAGKLNEAVQALGAEVRDNPSDAQRRIFLFELLCFAGDYERANKHLELIGEGNAQVQMGALLYRGALAADRTRQEMFEKRDFPTGPAPKSELSGTLNGKPFQSLSDADGRIGARLEVFVAGSYAWIPFEHIASVEIEPPKRLRDLLWTPAMVHTGPSFQGKELGEVLLPTLSALTWKHSDDTVRLGRATVWEDVPETGQSVPLGQKMLLVDQEELPILELRKLEFAVTNGKAS